MGCPGGPCVLRKPRTSRRLLSRSRRPRSGRLLRRPRDRAVKAGAGHSFATASVVSPRLADGCFSPAMQKPSRSRPAPSVALIALLYGLGRPLRPGAIVPPRPSALSRCAGWSGASAATRRRCGAIASRARLRAVHPIGLLRKRPPRRPGPFRPGPSARRRTGRMAHLLRPRFGIHCRARHRLARTGPAGLRERSILRSHRWSNCW